MIKTFVLIASMWVPGDGVTAFALDYDMSGADCIERLVEVYHSEEIEIESGVFVAPGKVDLSCEIDEIL